MMQYKTAQQIREDKKERQAPAKKAEDHKANWAEWQKIKRDEQELLKKAARLAAKEQALQAKWKAREAARKAAKPQIVVDKSKVIVAPVLAKAQMEMEAKKERIQQQKQRWDPKIKAWVKP